MSIPNASLPGIRQPLQDGVVASRPYYLFFQWAATNLPSVAKQVDDLSVRVDGLSGSGLSPNANVTGRYSIRTQGTLSAGIVTVSLQGDVANAGKTQYYGSDATQAKGWYAISDAFAESDTIEKAVDADGVTSFALVDLPDSGVGSILGITRDTKGRVSGTKAVTSDDLAEGDAHLFVSPAERAVIDALLASVITTTAGIPLQTTTGDLLTVHL